MAYHLTITAELNDWSLNGHGGVVGTIHNSSDKAYVDGTRFEILNLKRMTHYPAFKSDATSDPEHWLVHTYSDKFFLLYKSQMR